MSQIHEIYLDMNETSFMSEMKAKAKKIRFLRK
jgi:hypothetical protein